MVIFYPKDVQYVIDTLTKNNYEAFLVGGCVRDILLDTKPKDYDITTNALPEQVMSLFSKTIPTGLKHGTVTVLINDTPYEVTTYRIDGDYKDNRRPEDVQFVSSLKDDLSRRDFTINALAYNNKDGLQDFFNGTEDLSSRLIKAVGDADKRFNEDALRMLRAIRFSCQLNFNIELKTLKAIEKNSSLILNISSERIRDELCKILISPNPAKGFRLLNTTGILKYILPDLQKAVGFDQKTPYHDKDIFEHTLSVVENVPNDLTLRLAALFHDIGKPQCFFVGEDGIGHFYEHQKVGKDLSKNILKDLSFDNDTIDKVSTLVREHMSILFNPKSAAIKRLINRVGKELIFDLYELQKADILSSAPPFIALEALESTKEKTKEILEADEPLDKSSLNINGNILMKSLNIKPGKIVGEIIDYLMNKVIDEPKLNNEADLLILARDYINDKTNP
ncbi:CCA tRNA nucleotidyltransferase [Clostridium intestinale]|uniref:CCA tRNA nucleotidyltransferase n=1 Tax=Clostridium intestinale TaxID=36845 RepID=A0A7D6ZUH8_9CLOT|nr:CCA tRNA nucleotidyltransferase [Clostridium intestinale]QLY80053.1 CCA tRNA nucleotidyltransferase [Clostridium intestinale]